MAASVLGGNRRGRRRERARPISDINVTPMVDVMLVLLIIFMVTAPLLTTGVPVDLPKADAPALTDQKEPIQISINAQGQIIVGSGDVPTPMEDLVTRLKAITNNNPDATIWVRGDGRIEYATVLTVMSNVQQAGFTKVSLVVAPPSAAPAASQPAAARPARAAATAPARPAAR